MLGANLGHGEKGLPVMTPSQRKAEVKMERGLVPENSGSSLKAAFYSWPFQQHKLMNVPT